MSGRLFSLPFSPTAAVKVLVVYDDDFAGQCAASALNDLRRELPPQTQLVPVPWSVSSLCDLVGRSRALTDLAAADIVLLAISRSRAVPASVNRWLATGLEQKRSAGATIVALIDAAEAWTIALKNSAPAPAVPAQAPQTALPALSLAALSAA